MNVAIRKWYASYYVSPLRKWVYGQFSVFADGVAFHDESKKPVLTGDLVIKFSKIALMKKASSSFIFGAITIVDSKGHTHWFSSFQDRSSVFSAINHFFLSAATLSESSKVKSIPEGQRTKLGTNLLRIATDSEQTLQHAATRLSQQGEQIDSSISTMDDLHNDLDVVANVVSGLEAWLGRWQMPKKYIHVDPIILKDNDVPQVFDYEMLYSVIDSKKFHSQKDGVIRISADGVTILNLTQKIIKHFTWSMISTIRVASPWEMVVTQNFIGSSDLSYAIVCANLIHILRKIELFGPGRRKLDYDVTVQHRLQQYDTSAASRSVSTSSVTVSDKTSDKTTVNAKSNSTSRKYDLSGLVDDVDVQNDGQTQASMYKEVISDQEVDQLTATLSNLKSMALAVQHEEDIQNEKLDVLTDSVDRANDRLAATTKRTNRLL
ncbi:synaptosomal-associated protein 47-like [Haliotis rubra]|uniref:synaptosomal-associated protein 47-like n=1 Tax=Haliotis rubra TaxID=36100 RepID=UPI001EE5FC63|nr:synaptosomal-associated protein 47-like [Haliotis rubra]XP_046568389.1 synaptosomal-associated protein 47-like [Haliotis rubra]